MEYVYYKGKRYEAKVVEIGGNRLYSLYNKEGTLTYFVTEQQLDKKSLIDHSREHTHVITLYAIDAKCFSLAASENISPANNNGQFYTQCADAFYFFTVLFEPGRVNVSAFRRAHKRFTAELEDDAFVFH